MTFEGLFDTSPFAYSAEYKRRFLNNALHDLTKRHYVASVDYQRIMDAIGYDIESELEYEEIPFLPVRLFKQLDLMSISPEDVFKVVTSSGTTGQAVSKIYLDKETAALQQKVLSKIVSDFTGAERLPMLICDCPSVLKDRSKFSARGAGILGFSIFGTDRTYILDDEMKLNVNAIAEFLEKHSGKRILLFGFTFMIWQFVFKELKKLKNEGLIFDLSHSIMIHGGGWKKLASEAVSPVDFRLALSEVCGLSDIHDYYGMVEQTGSIYMQCEYGNLHASVFSDIIIRDEETLNVCSVGEKGIIQVVSCVPMSYPGHSLLTEDEGVLLGEDDCKCGRCGKYFKVIGRLKNAELRGCSDTYAKQIER